MNPVYRSGIDYFTPAAGSKETMSCEACQDELDVQRDIMQTHGKFGNAMPEKYHRLTDVFTCRNAGEDWHEQLIALMREIDKTASTKITVILETEIKELRLSRVATKKRSIWW